MKLKRQTLILTVANAVTRGLGFILRLIMARLMGAEAIGVMELAGSASMLALTPVTAGLPTAMSRVTAQREGAAQEDVLRAGLALVRRMAAGLIPALLLLSPALAWLLGDLRAIPAIALAAPAVLLMGACGVYSGYCVGRQNMRLPAVNECAEQSVRCILCAVLLALLCGRSIALDAALPGVAGLAAGLVVVVLYYRALPMDQPARRPDEALMRALWRLSAPMLLARLCAAGLRALNAVLLPVCLRRSGLSAGAATAQFGLLSGMAMPLMLLPGIVTGALCTVATPAVSHLEGTPAVRRVKRRLYLAGAGVGLASAVGLALLAKPIGTLLYHQPALPPLIVLLSPMAFFASVRQVQFGVIAGLGRQKHALGGTILSSLLALLLTALLAPVPRLRLYGAACAAVAGQFAAVVWNAVVLARAGD